MPAPVGTASNNRNKCNYDAHLFEKTAPKRKPTVPKPETSDIVRSVRAIFALFEGGRPERLQAHTTIQVNSCDNLEVCEQTRMQ